MQPENMNATLPNPSPPADPDAVYQASLAHFQEGRWSEAIAGFEEVLRARPDHVTAQVFLEDARLKASLDMEEPRPRRSAPRIVKRGLAVVGVLSLFAAVGIGLWLGYQVLVVPMRERQAAAAQRAEMLAAAQSQLANEDYAAAAEGFQLLKQQYPDDPAIQAGLDEAQLKAALTEQLAAAEEHIAGQEWPQALEVLEQVIEKDATFGNASARRDYVVKQQTLGTLLAEADAAYQNKDWARAAEAYEALKKADSSYEKERVRTALADSYVQEGRRRIETTGGTPEGVREALALFRQAAALQPGNEDIARENTTTAKVAQAQQLIARGDATAAAELLRPIHETDPQAVGGVVERVLNEATAIASVDPTPDPASTQGSSGQPRPTPPPGAGFREQYDYWMLAGDDAMLSGDYAGAAKSYNEAMAAAMHLGSQQDAAVLRFDAYTKASAATARTGDLEQAVELADTAAKVMIQSATAIPSSSYSGYIKQAQEYADDGEFQKALETYEMALRVLSTKHTAEGSCGEWSLLPCVE